VAPNRRLGLRQRIHKAWQALFSSSGEEYGPKSTEGPLYNNLAVPWVRFDQRKKLWIDLMDMDEQDSIPARALDIITRFAVIFPDEELQGFKLDAPPNELDILEPLAVLFQENSFEWARCMVHWGSHFVEIITDDDFNIVRLKPFPYPYQIQINTDEYGNLRHDDPDKVMKNNKMYVAAYEQYNDNQQLLAAFYPYQILHLGFGVTHGKVYYEPILACVTGVWKRLRAKEDGLAIARLVRAFPQRIHKIPVPIGATAEQTWNKISEYRNSMNVDTLVGYDSTNTRFRLVERQAPTAVDTDYYITRLYTPDGSRIVDGDIENLDASNPYLENLDDIYLDLRRVICALQTPMTYLNMRVGQKSFIDKSTEGEEESFAYLIKHVQHAYLKGVRQVFDLQLLLHGINPLTAKYTLIPPRISPSESQKSSRIDNLRAQTALMWAKLGLPPEVIGSQILNLSSAQIAAWMKKTGGKISQKELDNWIEFAKMQMSNDNENINIENGELEYYATQNEEEK